MTNAAAKGMRPLNNSAIPGKAAKAADLGSEEYSAKVATPIMAAIDNLPKAYRELVNEFGLDPVVELAKFGMTDAKRAREMLEKRRRA